ncbi:uncharacterized protein [Callorhinus ursinus]|uniref:uncharacterized protein n=1 Tax=Callorhinus ursinus TaxID=34884 RepID=UPI003CCFFA33
MDIILQSEGIQAAVQSRRSRPTSLAQTPNFAPPRPPPPQPVPPSRRGCSHRGPRSQAGHRLPTRWGTGKVLRLGRAAQTRPLAPGPLPSQKGKERQRDKGQGTHLTEAAGLREKPAHSFRRKPKSVIDSMCCPCRGVDPEFKLRRGADTDVTLLKAECLQFTTACMVLCTGYFLEFCTWQLHGILLSEGSSGPLTDEHVFLLSPDSSVHQLVRVQLCNLKAIIFCSPNGVAVELL